MKLIRAVGFANGVPCPHEGQYLETFDFEASGGRGYGTFTPHAERALQFATAGDAIAFWRTPSATVPTRPDGQPNRPLTALTVEIEDAP